MIDLLLNFEFYIVVDTLLCDHINFFVTAMDLLFSFEHSTFCHRLIYAIFHFCLTTQPADIMLKVSLLICHSDFLQVLQQSNIPMELLGLETQNIDLIAQGEASLQIIPYTRNLGHLLVGFVENNIRYGFL